MATTPKKKPAKKPAAKKPAAKSAAPKPAAKKAAPKQAAKSATETIRATVEERIVKPAKAAAETAWSATGNARETLTSAASQGSTFGLKMIEHAEQNAREAFNAMRAAAKSKDVSEVLKVQGEYLREQGGRSLAQAREVSEMIAQFGRDAIAPLTGKKKK